MNQAPAQSSKNLGLTPMEAIIAGAVVGIVALSFMFYLTGEVAGLIFKFHRPGTPLSNFLSIAGGVISNPGNPASAWPKGYQSAIPGPILYYITLIGLLTGGFFLFRFLRNFWTGIKKPDQNQAQWARAKDIKTLIVPHAGIRGRLVLGRSNGKLIATEPRQSVIVMGPTQTGKTTGFAVPAILEWDGPVIAASVKNDLVKDTFKWRRTQGEVWLFDPTRSTGFDYEDVRAGWSPLSEASHWGGARKVASWLCKANKAAGNNLSDGDFWFSAAEKLMAPYLFAAAVGGKDMATVLRWIDVNEEREVMSILQRANVVEAMTAFEANMKRDERTKSSIFTTAETIVDAYNDPLVCESASNPTIFSSELLNGGKNTLYICAPSHEQERLQSIFTAIVSQMKSAAYELAGKQNHPVDPPLLICIDEAANIAPLNDLDSIASTAAGIGIQLVTIFQDMAQIEARYKERARTVVNNHRAKVILSGISDTGTLEYVSKLCGEEEIDQHSTSTSAQGEKSTTDSKQQRQLASGAYLRRMKFGEGIVVYGQLSPAKLTLRQWFNDRVLKHMVEYGTRPGVVGGPTGSNTFSGGSHISKDVSSVPDVSSVGVDAQYSAGDVPSNQGSSLLASQTAMTLPHDAGSAEMSAFDKALAELRARETSLPQPAPTLPTPIIPDAMSAPTSSSAKWKPSGGGIVETDDTASDSNDSDTSSGGLGGFVQSSSPQEPTPSSQTASSPSKWAKPSHPTIVEQPDQDESTTPAKLSTVSTTNDTVEQSSMSTASIPQVQTPPTTPQPEVVPPSASVYSPTVSWGSATQQGTIPTVSDTFSQYGIDHGEETYKDVDDDGSSGEQDITPKPKWK